MRTYDSARIRYGILRARFDLDRDRLIAKQWHVSWGEQGTRWRKQGILNRDPLVSRAYAHELSGFIARAGKSLATADARAALEAAAPHLFEAAWHEGRKHGARYPYGERGLGTDDNPYRAAGAGE